MIKVGMWNFWVLFLILVLKILQGEKWNCWLQAVKNLWMVPFFITDG